MTNVVTDVSTLTTIPEKTLEKVLEKFIYSIVEGVVEDQAAEVDISEFDLFFGKLYIKHVGSEIKYKFVPSDTLSKAVTDSLKNKKLNFIDAKLNETLVKKFIDVYKNIC